MFKWNIGRNWILILALGGLSCFGNDDPVEPAEDTEPPGAVNDLTVVVDSTTHTSLVLTWTAPGDDGDTGTAATFDIRYSTENFDFTDWNSATQVSGEPEVGAAGTEERMTVTGLPQASRLFLAIKTADEVPNWSTLSNVAVDTTLGSLIVTSAQAGWYSLVDMFTGADLAHVQADQLQLCGEPSLGYLGRTLFILSPTGPGGAYTAIYRCNPFTGSGMTAITDDTQLDVRQLDGSPTGPEIAFSASATANWVEHIYTMGYTRDTPTRLTNTDEVVVIDGAGSAELLSATKPTWSPDGSRIAFDGYLRTFDPILRYNGILVMDANGDNKEVIYVQQLEESHFDTPCWTADGNYVAFMEQNPINTGVMFLSIASGNSYNLWDDLDVTGWDPDMLTTDPLEMRVCVYYNFPSGSDIWIADLITVGDAISATTPVKLTDQASSGHSYANPDWVTWEPLFE